VIFSDRIWAAMAADGGRWFTSGYTYYGHPVACAAALKNIEIMEREDLITRTREDTGPYLAKALAGLNDHPLVGETRSLGLIGAVEIVREKGTNHRFLDKEGEAGPIVRDICIKNGLMVRAIRDTIVCCPPLIVSHAEIDELVGIIGKSLTEAEPILRALKPEAAS
jgi:putrescine aminotransferase